MLNPEKMPSPQAVADLFTMRAFEIEHMEEKDGDTLYELKLTPDRSPYARGIRYIALELSLLVPELIFNPKFATFTKTTLDISGVNTEIDANLVEDQAKKLVPMYSLTKIENVHNAPSPESVVKKLNALGQQSRGTVVDLTNLVMYDTGQPLHAFDADKVDGQIRAAVLEADTEVQILGGKKVSLKKGMLVIKDDVDILAIAGVKGCAKAEVTESTKNIYLESATFDRVTVRKTSRSLDIINDSSKCFEQGVSPERFLLAVQTYIEHIREFIPDAKVGVTKVSTDVSEVVKNVSLPTIEVSVKRSVLLIDPSDASLIPKFSAFLEGTLEKTGAYVEKKDEDTYIVTAPLYRTDLQTESDVIDEFMRNIGYEIIAYKQTEAENSEEQEKKYTVLKSAKKTLVEKGFTEVLLHTLVDSKKNLDAVVLENALTSERDSLRALLSPEMEQAIIKNFPYLDIVGKSSVNLFEVGYVFEVMDGSIKQKLHIALGVGMPKNFKKKGNTAAIQPILEDLFPGIKIVNTSNTETVYIVEGDITDLIKESALTSEVSEAKYLSSNARIKSFPYKKASIYPSMSRDVAFFVEGGDKEIVENEIRNIAQNQTLIETVTLFDEFSKDGKTSYGYRFVFQSYEKTLTEGEVNEIMSSIAQQIQEKGWTVR